MKRFITILAVVLMSLAALTGCGPTEAETIKIGVNLELTGEVSVYGTPERLAFQLAVKEINAKGGIDGKQVELVMYDNAYDTAKAVENAPNWQQLTMLLLCWVPPLQLRH
jgi:branched-chain amino acid transport system substrate-binding protein